MAWAVVVVVLGVAALNGGLLLIAVAQSLLAGDGLTLPSGLRSLILGATVIAGEVVIFVAAWLFSVRKYGADWRLLGYRAFRATRALPLAALVVLFGLLVNIAYVLIIQALGRSDLLPQPVLPELGRGPLGIAILVLAASVAAPLAEETFFRGLVFPTFSRRFGTILGAAASAAMFAVAHLQLGAVAPIFVLGLSLTWLYYRTGSLWPSIIAHASYNTLAVVATVYVQQS